METEQPSSEATIREQATALFVRRLEQRFSPATWWQGWFWSRSPKHRRALSDVEAMWKDVHTVLESDPLVVNRHRPRARASSRVRGWQVAAVVVILGVITSTTVPITHPTQVSFMTEVGQWALKKLDDGTTAHIGPRSRIEVSYSAASRSVSVFEGEVWFDVVKDTRPFSVDTEEGTIRATGTVFGVARRDDEASVTVAEGSVVVSSRTSAPTEVVLQKGQQTRITEQGATPPRFVNTQRAFAWARGQMVDVTGLTVEEVTHDLNERNRMQIRVADPTLAAMTLPFLAIRGDAPDTFLHYMSMYGSIRAVPDGNDVVRLEYMKSSAR